MVSIGKSINYRRLEKGLTIEELSRLSGIAAESISSYENGLQKPDHETREKLAEVLDINVCKFYNMNCYNIKFIHKSFCKDNKLSKLKQEFINASTEEYIQRFYQLVDFLGDQILSKPLKPYALSFSGDTEEDAKALRNYLPVSQKGPITELIDPLEKSGIIFCFLDIDDPAFSGSCGFVNDHPYIAINQNMTAEQIRQTIAHQLVHLFFREPDGADQQELEKTANEIGEAFLFLKEDAILELGIKRNEYGRDMILVSKKYGISAYTLVKRARLCGIITPDKEQEIYERFEKLGWKEKEPSRIAPQKSQRLLQLVMRAICENEISVGKGVELTKIHYLDLVEEISGLEGAL